MWKRHCFGWEYKGKHANLDAAFDQLRQYALALENPPLRAPPQTPSLTHHRRDSDGAKTRAPESRRQVCFWLRAAVSGARHLIVASASFCPLSQRGLRLPRRIACSGQISHEPASP